MIVACGWRVRGRDEVDAIERTGGESDDPHEGRTS